MKHLWEIDHPYYMTEGCYYSNECHSEHETWEDFFAEMGDADIDYNLVIRWDWRMGEDWGVEGKEGELLIQTFQQRKARPWSHCITGIKFTDEQKVIEYLKPHWERLKQNWEGIS